MRFFVPAPLILVACDTVGMIGSGSRSDAGRVMMTADGGVPSADQARAFFDMSVEPLLLATCGDCHSQGGTGVPFVVDPIYDTLLGSHLVDLDAPSSSLVVQQGQHTGPAWTAPEAATIGRWLELEAARGRMTEEPVIETERVRPTVGPNAIDLAAVGLPGTQLRFVGRRLASGLHVEDLELVAGPMGARVKGPALIRWINGEARPDLLNSFDELDFDLQPAERAPFYPSSIILQEFPDNGEVSFLFEEAGPFSGSTTGPVGPDAGVGTPTACAQVAMFTAIARPQFAQYCVSCHGNAGSAPANALNMVNMMDDARQQEACNSILPRVNFTSPDMSSIFRVPAPGTPSHSFELSAGELDAFRTTISMWINAE